MERYEEKSVKEQLNMPVCFVSSLAWMVSMSMLFHVTCMIGLLGWYECQCCFMWFT